MRCRPLEPSDFEILKSFANGFEYPDFNDSCIEKILVVVDDEAVPPPWLPPQAATKIPAAATATTAGS